MRLYKIIMEHTRYTHASSAEDAIEKSEWIMGGIRKRDGMISNGHYEPIIKLLRVEEDDKTALTGEN